MSIQREASSRELNSSALRSSELSSSAYQKLGRMCTRRPCSTSDDGHVCSRWWGRRRGSGTSTSSTRCARSRKTTPRSPRSSGSKPRTRCARSKAFPGRNVPSVPSCSRHTYVHTSNGPGTHACAHCSGAESPEGVEARAGREGREGEEGRVGEEGREGGEERERRVW